MSSPLSLSRQAMESLGHQALAMVIRHIENLPQGRAAGRMPTRAETQALLGAPFRDEGEDPAGLLTLLEREVFPPPLHADHPRFYAFVPSPTNFVSIVGDLLTSGHNLFMGHWMASSTATQIELNVLDWLKAACGLPAEGAGILLSGGSMANLCALVVARERVLRGPDPRGVLYCSDQTHSSLLKGARVVGFSREQRRIVPTDGEQRLRMDALAAMVQEDRQAGRRPFCVVANAGTTNSGAVDPLHAMADFCAAEGLWLHVDGAYGAAAVITPRGRAALDGLGRADSITLDPHKWLFQPYEIGCLLVRDASALHAAFRVDDTDDQADYLEDVRRHIQGEVNFLDLGPQLTRSFKALKLWLSLRTFGLDAFRAAVTHGFRMADHAEELLRADPRWELVTPARMAILTFRWRGSGELAPQQIDRITARTADLMREDGYAVVMSTALAGRPVLRLCPINPATHEGEIAETIRRLTACSLTAQRELEA